MGGDRLWLRDTVRVKASCFLGQLLVTAAGLEARTLRFSFLERRISLYETKNFLQVVMARRHCDMWEGKTKEKDLSFDTGFHNKVLGRERELN